MNHETIEVGGVWLTTRTDDRGRRQVVVSVEVDREWRRCVVELDDGPISHIIEPAGVRTAPRDNYVYDDRFDRR